MLSSLNDPFTELLVNSSNQSTGQDDPTARVEEGKENKVVQSILGQNGIAYLRIGSFEQEYIADLVEAESEKISNCDGIVLDLRYNNGGRLNQALESSGCFVANGRLGTVEFRRQAGMASLQYFVNEDQFYATESLPDGTSSITQYKRRRPLLSGKPLVPIVNWCTASASELLVTTLVQNAEPEKVHIVGSSNTPGKGIGQGKFDILDGRAKVKVTCCRWLAPGGEWLGDCGQTWGDAIEPDTLVPDDHGPECIHAAFTALAKMLGHVH
jgi:C-terminal processing protease CtpA/Prc